MNNRPTFSIIVPIYNTEIYIADCVRSIISQTYDKYELILINDGSTDESLAIINRLAVDRNSRIRIIDKENEGVSAARNTGLDLAVGQYVLFVDSDDYVLDKFALEKLADVLNTETDTVIYGVQYEGHRRSSKVIEKKYTTEEEVDHLLFEIIKSEEMNSPFNKVYSRQIIEDHMIRFNRDIKMGEDLLFNSQYFQSCNLIRRVSDVFYFYRTTNQNAATKKYMANKYADLMYVNKKMSEWLRMRTDVKLLSLARYIRIKNILSCLKDMYHTASPLDRDERRAMVLMYKKENPGIVIWNCGLKVSLITLAYSMVNATLLNKIISLFYGVRR